VGGKGYKGGGKPCIVTILWGITGPTESRKSVNRKMAGPGKAKGSKLYISVVTYRRSIREAEIDGRAKA